MPNGWLIGLAAHRGVDLGQQGGRHLDEVDPTLVAGRGETGHVTDDAAAQGDQGSLAVMPLLQQGIEDQLQGFPLLVGLAVGQHHRGDLMALQCLEQGFQIERSDRFVADHRDPATDDMRREPAGVAQQVFTDVNGIATLA